MARACSLLCGTVRGSVSPRLHACAKLGGPVLMVLARRQTPTELCPLAVGLLLILTS